MRHLPALPRPLLNCVLRRSPRPAHLTLPRPTESASSDLAPPLLTALRPAASPRPTSESACSGPAPPLLTALRPQPRPAPPPSRPAQAVPRHRGPWVVGHPPPPRRPLFSNEASLCAARNPQSALGFFVPCLRRSDSQRPCPSPWMPFVFRSETSSAPPEGLELCPANPWAAPQEGGDLPATFSPFPLWAAFYFLNQGY